MKLPQMGRWSQQPAHEGWWGTCCAWVGYREVGRARAALPVFACGNNVGRGRRETRGSSSNEQTTENIWKFMIRPLVY